MILTGDARVSKGIDRGHRDDPPRAHRQREHVILAGEGGLPEAIFANREGVRAPELDHRFAPLDADVDAIEPRLALAATRHAEQEIEHLRDVLGRVGDRLLGVDGQYRARGINADGTIYEGDVWITQQSDVIEMTWEVQGDTFRGQGVIEGRVVTVDWGSDTPVIYVVMADGELHGTWDDGRALEKLTPR